MRKKNTMMLILACIFSVSACGDTIADGGYQGEPKMVVRGSINSLSDSADPDNTYVGVGWINWARNGDTASFQTLQLDSTSFPAQFELGLYDDPARESLNEFQDEDATVQGRLGTGFLVTFEDRNGNGLGELPVEENSDVADRILGISTEHVVLFVEDLNAEFLSILESNQMITNLDSLKPGYNLARGVCASEGQIHDRLQIVGDESVTVEDFSWDPVDNCLDFY